MGDGVGDIAMHEMERPEADDEEKDPFRQLEERYQ